MFDSSKRAVPFAVFDDARGETTTYAGQTLQLFARSRVDVDERRPYRRVGARRNVFGCCETAYNRRAAGQLNTRREGDECERVA